MGLFGLFRSKTEKQNELRDSVHALLDEGYEAKEVATQLNLSVQKVAAFMKSRKKVSASTETPVEPQSNDVAQKKSDLEMKKLDLKIKELDREAAELTGYTDKVRERAELDGKIKVLQLEKDQLEKEVEDLRDEVAELEEEAQRLGVSVDQDTSGNDPISNFLMGLVSKGMSTQTPDIANQTTLVQPEGQSQGPAEKVAVSQDLSVEDLAKDLINHMDDKQKKLAVKNPTIALAMAKQWNIREDVAKKALEILKK